MNQDRTSTITNSQLKEGYKQTEVGIIPEDWEVKPLAGSISIIHGYGFESQFFSSHGALFLTTPGNFYEDGGFRDLGEKQKFYNGFLPEGFLLSHEDLIVAMTEQAEGLLGSAAFIPTKGKYLHNQRLGKIKVTSANISTRFLYWVFNSKAYRRKVNETAAGTKVKHTSPSKLLEISVLLPSSKSEQEAIACTLSDIDALIESLDRLLTKKRQIKQGAMQELLTGKRRVKGFGFKNLNYRQSSMGLIPDDWEQIEIGSSIDMLTGFPFPSSGYSSSGIRLLRGSNVKRGVTDWAEEETKYWASINHDIKQYLLKDKDIVIAMDGSLVGRSFAMLSARDLPAVLLQRVARIRSNVLDQKFLKEWICSRYFTGHCDAVKTVTAIPHISPDNIRSFSILKPPTIEEQIEIANILSDMDAEIGSIESKLTKTRQLKQGMMHELLTGRIRLVD